MAELYSWIPPNPPDDAPRVLLHTADGYRWKLVSELREEFTVLLEMRRA